MPAQGETDLRKRLASRIRARRWDELGLTQDELAERADVGVNTIIRMEKGEFAERRTGTWAKLEKALNFPTRYFSDYLDGLTSEDLEARYRRLEPATESGRPVAIVEDALYRVFMAGSPGTSLAEFDRVRRRVFEVLHEAGIDIAERHDETSSGTDSGT